jgi:hypothetical protein
MEKRFVASDLCKDREEYIINTLIEPYLWPWGPHLLIVVIIFTNEESIIWQKKEVLVNN